ncbi:MAG: alpha/beta hydrolase [Actinobacteria bacterium]|nr:alpha/beta hydrolase [Actinomycetota bacterium]
MKKRVGIVGGVVGALAAGTAVVLAVDHTANRRRRAIEGVDAVTALDQWPVDRSGRVAAEDGVGLYYEQNGPLDAGLTVVFVHGYCLAMGEFTYQRRALAEHFGDRIRMVFYDQRSHGRSDRSPRDRATIDQLGADLSALVDELIPDGPIVLVGHSMGGMTVMALADQRPDLFARGRVAAVALISTSAGKMADVTLGLPAILARLKAPVLPLLLRGARRGAAVVERGRAMGSDIGWVFVNKLSFAGPAVDPAASEYLASMIAATRIEVVADFYPAVTSHDKLDALKRLDGLDVLVICGDHDLLTPLDHSEAIAAALPGAELVVVPDTGHVVLMEQPDAVTDPLAQLITRALPTRRRGARRR